MTKFSDLGAYCVGSLIGKHKMIPRISPGKTWEGFGGAIVISTLVSLAFAHFAEDKLMGMTPLHAVILGRVLELDRGGRRFDRIDFQARSGRERFGPIFSRASAAFSTCSTACSSMRRSCISICGTCYPEPHCG